jgi:hypothetical protein
MRDWRLSPGTAPDGRERGKAKKKSSRQNIAAGAGNRGGPVFPFVFTEFPSLRKIGAYPGKER